MQTSGEATCRGVAIWASTILGRNVTFKDCARRPVFTKLANAMSVFDAAKAVGVRPQTMAHYHVAQGADVKRQAAEVLAAPPKARTVGTKRRVETVHHACMSSSDSFVSFALDFGHRCG